MTRITLFAVMFLVAGCASNGTEVPAQGTGDVAEAVAESKPAVDKAKGTKDIEFMPAPEVAQVAGVTEIRDEMVCVRVALTGTHIMEKVCRPRSEIEATMRETQRAVRQLEMSTSNSGAPKN